MRKMVLGVLTAVTVISAALRVPAATFTVTTAADPGPGSLREAILSANANAGHDFIHFNIAPASTVHVIAVLSQLPVLTDAVTIDGLTQPGSLPNSLAEGFNATNLVTISGASLTNGPPPPPGGDPTTNTTHGLVIRANQVTVRGLRMVHFVVNGNATNMQSAIYIANSRSNVVESCVLGTDASTAIGNPNYAGITVTNSSFVRIGGTNAAQRNLIASNPGWQMRFLDGVSNVIQGNFVGLPGLLPAAFIANGPGAVFERGYRNRIGGSETGARNFFGGVGAAILHDLRGAVHFRQSHTNEVLGNWFGLRPAQILCNQPGGPQPCGLGVVGVSQGVLIEASSMNRIGGATAGQRNVFVDGASGIEITGAEAHNNVVQGNRFGTHPDGTATNTHALAPANPANAVSIKVENGAHDNLIGGAAVGEGNLIASSSEHGISLRNPGTVGNRILGNFIGTDVSGTNALPNGSSGYGSGVFIGDNASGNEIGGPAPGERNLISGNQTHGVHLSDNGTETNRVRGNFIGPDVTGTRRLPLPLFQDVGNFLSGVRIENGASRNLIGGTGVGEGNLISGNLEDGVSILENSESGTTTENEVIGNRIGSEVTGTQALPNNRSGVWIEATRNFVGAEAVGAGNLISGNGGPGVVLMGAANVVQRNLIGTRISGAAALANTNAGVRIAGLDNVVGGASSQEGNVISGNSGPGVLIVGAMGAYAQVLNNFIGTTAAGNAALPNHGDGVLITQDANNNATGAAGAGNLISGNTGHGVAIIASPSFSGITEANALFDNRIGTDVAGQLALPNGSNGVYISSAPGSLLVSNQVSGNPLDGVYLTGITNATLLGNFIGTVAGGASALANGGEGVLIDNASGVQIGDRFEDVGNRIAFNTRNGVLIRGNSAGNSLFANSIEGNGGLGVNLQPGGELNSTVTPNDALDPDVGPNALQNFPLITGAQTGFNTTAFGVLHASPSRTFTVEIFRNLAADPSGHGEGSAFIGRTSVTTDANGNAAWSLALSGNLVGQFLTVAATDDTTGDTSEFSPALRVPVSLAFAYARQEGNNFEAGFLTENGLGYTVLTNRDLNTPNWFVFTNLTGNGAVRSFQVPVGSAAQTFFRLRQP